MQMYIYMWSFQIGRLQNKYHFELKEDCFREPMPQKTTALLLNDKVWCVCV